MLESNTYAWTLVCVPLIGTLMLPEMAAQLSVHAVAAADAAAGASAAKAVLTASAVGTAAIRAPALPSTLRHRPSKKLNASRFNTINDLRHPEISPGHRPARHPFVAAPDRSAVAVQTTYLVTPEPHIHEAH
jgi:hypothetical protein